MPSGEWGAGRGVCGCEFVAVHAAIHTYTGSTGRWLRLSSITLASFRMGGLCSVLVWNHFTLYFIFICIYFLLLVMMTQISVAANFFHFNIKPNFHLGLLVFLFFLPNQIS